MEGHVGAGVAGDQVADRVPHRLQEGARDADRQRGAQGVAQPGRVLDGGPPLLAGDPDPDRPAGLLEGGQPGGCRAALDRLGGAQRAEDPQQVGDSFDVAGPPVLGQPLQVRASESMASWSSRSRSAP